MSTTQINEIHKPFTRRLSSIESKFESPLGKKKGEISKISENIKLLSNEITSQYAKRATMKNNENIHEIISNLFDKESKLLSLNNKQSIIHELDFLQNSPQQQRKKNLKQGVKRRSTMTSQKTSNLFINKSFSRTNSDNMEPLRKLSSLNPRASISKKNSIKKVEFNIFDNKATKLINQGTIDSQSESESISETEREYLLFGFSNTKRIKKNRIRSIENNPKKLGFYEKNMFHKQKKLLEVEMLRNKIKNEKRKDYKEAPELSNKTKEIIKEKLNETKPLYQRIDEVMENKSNYIHKLKKFHNEESKNLKLGKLNKNYENVYMHELSNIDNFEFSHLFKTGQVNSNSVRNNKTNFNNKFLDNCRTLDSSNNTFIKMLNDTNIDLHNITSIPAVNTHNNIVKNETMDYSDNFKIDEENDEINNLANSKFSNVTYLKYMQNQEKNQDEKNTNNKNKDEKSGKNINKNNISYKNFAPEENEKFDIQYPERTINWIKNKEHWINNKQRKLEQHRELTEITEMSHLQTLFKPLINKNSKKIVNSKKNLSRSLNMSQREFHNNYKDEDIDAIDYSNYNIDENINVNSKTKIKDNNNKELYRYDFNSSQERTVFENLYSRRFEGEEKRKKILNEISCDFKPKTNSNYHLPVNASNPGYLGENLKSSKFNGIPNPKKTGNKNINERSYNNEESVNNYKNDNYNDMDQINSDERKERIKEIKRHREEMRNKKRKGNENESHLKNAKKTLMELLDEVDIENQKIKHDENEGKRRKSESNQLYKLNVRSASAWDKNKENSVYFDRKFAKILSKAGMIKY